MDSNNLINIFAEFQKNMFREIGGLMGAVACAQQPAAFDIAAMEARILAAVDARLQAFEPLRVGVKRPRTPSIESEDDNEEAPVSVVNYAQQTAPMAPVKVTQQTILSFFEDKTVRDLTASLNAASLGEHAALGTPHNQAPAAPVTPSPTPAAAPASPVLQAAPSAAPATPIMKPAPAPAPSEEEHESEDEEAEEESGTESDDEAEEDAADEDEEEEDLTEINYKGKRYFMDGEYNIYGLDADGELVEEPVGRYDEKTRRILFN